MPITGPKSCTVCNEDEGYDRTSFGIYSGHRCDKCEENSGYKQEGREGFDPSYAGEHYEEEEY